MSDGFCKINDDSNYHSRQLNPASRYFIPSWNSNSVRQVALGRKAVITPWREMGAAPGDIADHLAGE